MNRGGIGVELLIAKTKVAPLEQQTIPRLELLSCFLLAKLMSTVLNALTRKYKEAAVYCWTDSEIALHWITGIHKQWTSWVESRITQIRNYVLPVNWRHVPGAVNPADVGTRNITSRDLLPDSCWFTGPKFLHCPVDGWPSTKFDVNTTTIELKSTGSKLPSNVLVAITNPNISNILNVEKFSSLHRLYTVLAYVLRFKHYVRFYPKYWKSDR